MLASLLNINSYVSDVYIYDLANMVCKLNHLHLKKYFIQQQLDIITNIYVSYNLFLLQLSYIRWCKENIQHSMLDSPH